MKPAKSADLPNHEVVVLAAYLCGAQYSHIDTEDIAVKANEIAPGRFSWRKYKEQINIDTVRKRLWDATKPEKGALLIGSEKQGWLVTEKGVNLAQQKIGLFHAQDLSRTRLSQSEQVWANRERVRMTAEEAFKKFSTGHEGQITAQEAERFFRIDDYVIGNSRSARLERAKNAFADDPQLGAAIGFIAQLVRER